MCTCGFFVSGGMGLVLGRRGRSDRFWCCVRKARVLCFRLKCKSLLTALCLPLA